MNRTHKSLENSSKALDLLRELRTSNDTPSLISWITEDVDRMNLAGKLASISEESDPAGFQWLVTMCGKVGFSVKDMQNRIRPVARALGLYGIQQNKNYYQLLGVNQGATEKEIRTAFRTRARRIHPDTRDDHHVDKEAFVALNTAYKTLSNPLLRRRYDQEIHADGIWNEGPKSRKHRQKERPKSKVKFVFLFSVIFLFLAGIILFSDVFFNMIAMQDIDEQIFSANRKPTVNSENIVAPTKSIRPVDPTLPSSQPTPDKQVESEERSNGKDLSRNSSPTVEKQKAQTQKLKQTIDPKSKMKHRLEASKNKKQGITTPEPKADGPVETLVESSRSTDKPLASLGPIDKQKHARLQSEVKVLDLIKDPPTQGGLQSFLNRYTTAYQERNEDRFFAFFTPNAKENKQPISTLIQAYRQNFRDFENIDYRVHLKEYVVDLNEAVIKLKAEYRLNWISRQDGKQYSSKGDLSMSLVADKDISYKIKALNY